MEDEEVEYADYRPSYTSMDVVDSIGKNLTQYTLIAVTLAATWVAFGPLPAGALALLWFGCLL